MPEKTVTTRIRDLKRLTGKIEGLRITSIQPEVTIEVRHEFKQLPEDFPDSVLGVGDEVIENRTEKDGDEYHTVVNIWLGSPFVESTEETEEETAEAESVIEE